MNLPLLSKALPALTCLLAFTLAISPLVATAQGRNQYLEEGKNLIIKGKPQEAIEELQRALDFPELPIPQRLEILAYLGAAHHLVGNDEEASAAWEERVRLDPDGDLPKTLSGDLRSAYVQIRAGVVVLEHLPPPGALAGRTVEIRVNMRDRYAATQDLLVYHRRSGKKKYEATALERDDLGWRAKLTLPPLAGLTAGYEYEYYVVALSEEGELLHAAGSKKEPLAVRVMAPADDPGPMTASIPDPVADPEPGKGIVIVRRDPPPSDDPEAISLVDPIRPPDPDLVRGRNPVSVDPADAVPPRPGAPGYDRQDEVIEAVEIDVDPDPEYGRRRGILRPGRTGSAKWVWITIGAFAVVAGGTAAIVAGTSGDKIPTTSLGVIRYP